MKTFGSDESISSSSAQVKRLLRQLGVRPRKSLGQHFLTDEAVLETIVEAAELSPQDTVIEVGPGLGVLTVQLARRAGSVVAVELDTRLASLLKHRLSSLRNVCVVNVDILEVSLSQLLKGKNDYKVVANLPYYITSPVLRHFVESSPRPSLMVVMVQKEVGEAIVAAPGKMSLLAVSLQLYARPRIVARVASRSFYPQPKVDSVILRLDLLSEPAVPVADLKDFLEVVRCGFSSPRKQLHNSLAQGLRMKSSQVVELLRKAGVESQRRAETLSLVEWSRVYEVLQAWKHQAGCDVNRAGTS